jgi:ribonuclease BN (tRNA processing enzyme)
MNNKRFKKNKLFRELAPCLNKACIQAWLHAFNFRGRQEDSELLGGLDYDQIMSTYKKHFERHLNFHTIHEPTGQNGNIHFVGLQRWNSISPAEGRSLGGGYFLFTTTDRGLIDLGIAVDPGFDFVKNFFHCGFSLKDIDLILISHAHLDHIRDFESIIHLLQEFKEHVVYVILSLGTHNRLKHIFENSAFKPFLQPIIIDSHKDIVQDYFERLGDESNTMRKFVFEAPREHPNNKTIAVSGKKNKADLSGKNRLRIQIPKRNDNANEDATYTKRLTIIPTRAYHDDYSDISDSFGFIIKFYSNGNEKWDMSFGYTGDTKWVSEVLYTAKEDVNGYKFQSVANQYKKCDVLLIHLGSLVDYRNDVLFSKDNNKGWNPKECEKIIRVKNHPYFPGIIGFFNELVEFSEEDDQKPSLILLSEFGEELRGSIRTDFAKRLQGVYQTKIIPVDIGLDIFFGRHANKAPKGPVFEFWCVQCRHFYPIDRIDYQMYGQDEAIFYLCQTCKKTTPMDVLQDRLRHVYEVGRQLRIHEPEN